MAHRIERDPASANQLKIARDTAKLSCIGVRIMGGPNHFESAAIIHRLTGVFVNIEAGCTCRRVAGK